MRDKDSYRDLLGERIENAYREKGDISKPTEIQMAKWKQIAKMRRREKIRRRKIIASLASVFAMVFCVGMVSMFQIPDAEAGRDGIVDIIDSRDNDEIMMVDTYENQEDLPRDIREEFLMFEELQGEIDVEEIKAISVGKETRIEETINYNEESIFITQRKKTGGSSFKEVFPSNSVMEIWDGREVHISRFYTEDCQTLYATLIDDIFVIFMCNNDIDSSVIKDIIKGAS